MSDLHMHEEHGEVVRTWQTLGYRREHVVCFDRHLDLKPLSAEGRRRCDAAGQDLGALNRSLPLREAEGVYGLDDFWSVGPVSGAVTRLTWIPPSVPPGRPGRQRLLSAIGYLPMPTDVLDVTRFEGNLLVTHLYGLAVEVCGLTDFPVEPGDDFRIDVDLDWFAEPGAADEIDPRWFGAELRRRGWAGRVDSMTFSVRSGFLDDAQRRIGMELLTEIGRAGTQRPATEAAPTPDAALAALRGDTPMTPARLRAIRETELDGLGGLGLSLEGLLRLNGTASAADLRAAEQAWFSAAEAGVPSTWLAYRLGMRCFSQRRLGRARRWFDRTLGSLADPLEGHAQLMAALCSVRLGDLDEAAERAHRLSDALPLNMRAGELAMSVDALAGRRRDERLADRLRRIKELVI